MDGPIPPRRDTVTLSDPRGDPPDLGSGIDQGDSVAPLLSGPGGFVRLLMRDGPAGLHREIDFIGMVATSLFGWKM